MSGERREAQLVANGINQVCDIVCDVFDLRLRQVVHVDRFVILGLVRIELDAPFVRDSGVISPRHGVSVKLHAVVDGLFIGGTGIPVCLFISLACKVVAHDADEVGGKLLHPVVGVDGRRLQPVFPVVSHLMGCVILLHQFPELLLHLLLCSMILLKVLLAPAEVVLSAVQLGSGVFKFPFRLRLVSVVIDVPGTVDVFCGSVDFLPDVIDVISGCILSFLRLLLLLFRLFQDPFGRKLLLSCPVGVFFRLVKFRLRGLVLLLPGFVQVLELCIGVLLCLLLSGHGLIVLVLFPLNFFLPFSDILPCSSLFVSGPFKFLPCRIRLLLRRLRLSLNGIWCCGRMYLHFIGAGPAVHSCHRQPDSPHGDELLLHWKSPFNCLFL